MTALRDIRVLELAEDVSGEYCGKLLADFGATVIKVERPGCGSPTRQMAPLVAAADRPGNELERSGLFAYLNTGKQSLALDVGSTAGSATLAQLMTRVDIVIDDHPREWLTEAGIDLAALEQHHPALVFCSIRPFGLNPPPERRHAEDLNVFHSSGWGYHTPSGGAADQAPLKGAGRFLTSYEAGLEAALCISAALFERTELSQGRLIEISKQAVLASRIDYVLGQMVCGDMDVSTSRNQFDLFGPAGIFACQDGFAYIWMSTPGHWDALRQLLDDPAWMTNFPARWLERECTPERVALCREHIADWLRTQNKHEVSAAAQQLGLTLVAVNNAADLLESPQYVHRQFFTEIAHPVIGTATYPTVPYRMSETPARAAAAAPLLGQHDGEWLREKEISA